MGCTQIDLPKRFSNLACRFRLILNIIVRLDFIIIIKVRPVKI